MKLSKTDKRILTEDGYTKSDIDQIQRLKYKFYDRNDKRITQVEAKKLLTKNEFLSSIGRATFHLTATANGGISVKSNLYD